jgi:hypothetical protein
VTGPNAGWKLPHATADGDRRGAGDAEQLAEYKRDGDAPGQW